MKVVIVGAGISGLYLASQLCSLSEVTQITIYEKSGKVGGKLRSEKIDNEVLEHGAWRISKDHKLVNSLISDDMKTFDYPETEHHDEDRQHCSDMSIFASRLLQGGIEHAANLDALSGYIDSDVRPDDGYERHQTKYFGLSDGYESIAKRLHVDIEQCKKVNIHLKHIIRNVMYSNSIIEFTVLSNQSSKSYSSSCDRIVFACSAHQAAQCCESEIKSAFRPLTSSVNALPLCRIHGHSSLSHTDHIDVASPLYRHIALEGRKWNILSYTSGKLAVALRDILTSNPEITKDIKFSFWPNGTHMWRPAFNFDMARNAWNAVCVSKNVYIVGESLSDMQGWCEGALRSVKILLKQFNKAKQSNAEIKRQYELKNQSSKIVFYRNKPIDISQWSSRHPGGPELIENIHKYTRKKKNRNTWDITETFDKAHLNDDAFRQLFALQVYS